jgi:hypothetical protein
MLFTLNDYNTTTQQLLLEVLPCANWTIVDNVSALLFMRLMNYVKNVENKLCIIKKQWSADTLYLGHAVRGGPTAILQNWGQMWGFQNDQVLLLVVFCMLRCIVHT